jgi:4-amino-4-deoxy-L-arabinose transferase-like glycosyltransferase
MTDGSESQAVGGSGRATGARPSRRWWALLVGLLLVACATSFTRNLSYVPLETHEAFVARSAEEMFARNSWLVPYFNDQPRLKKPPLSYWLVMAVDRLHDADGVITELECRLPSALAGVVLVILVACLGAVLMDRPTGLLAGLLTAACAGFASYSQSARPEMVYAALCTGAMLAFAVADRWLRQQRAAAGAGWVSRSAWFLLGLALLAKGPQLPAMIIVGILIAMSVSHQWRHGLAVLRPVSGIIIALAVSGWWYAAIFLTLPDAMSIWRVETVDRFVDAREPMSSYLDPYYLYRTAGLVLPWLLFYPFAVLAPWVRELKRDRSALLLWWIVIAVMAGLSLSLGRRWYYMLPALGPIMILMAAGAIRAAATLRAEGKSVLVRWLLALHALGIGAAACWLRFDQPPRIALPLWALSATIAAAIIGTALIIRSAGRGAAGDRRALAAMVLVAVVFFAGASARGSLRQARRFEAQTFSRHVSELVADDATLLGWRGMWAVEQYELHRSIPQLQQMSALLEAMGDSDSVYVLVRSGDIFPQTSGYAARRLFAGPYDGDPEGKQLWQVSRVSAAEER